MISIQKPQVEREASFDEDDIDTCINSINLTEGKRATHKEASYALEIVWQRIIQSAEFNEDHLSQSFNIKAILKNINENKIVQITIDRFLH